MSNNNNDYDNLNGAVTRSFLSLQRHYFRFVILRSLISTQVPIIESRKHALTHLEKHFLINMYA